jgi:hypothetical protein
MALKSDGVRPKSFALEQQEQAQAARLVQRNDVAVTEILTAVLAQYFQDAQPHLIVGVAAVFALDDRERRGIDDDQAETAHFGELRRQKRQVIVI